MKILIVDDDPATVIFMRLAFASRGHDVSTASSIAEAIGRASDDTPDVVLSDLTFGSAIGADLDREHDGCSLARSLRSMPATADVGLLAISGAGSPDLVSDTTDSGFDGFVSKPVDLGSLLEQVDGLGGLV
ncbi:MAG: response regulator, partial [Ilumatobacter sp.]|uniref:response regulator n=1 Tax=Ilumatobacter sp. TaxID=1967498 RepID=UPI003C7314F2